MKLKQNKTVLVIGPHPDDLEFGCGGTLLNFSDAGYSIYLLLMTKGDAGGISHTRWEEQERAAKVIGAEDVFFAGFEDTKIKETKETINKIEEVLHKIKPGYTFVNYFDDTHQDHRAVSMATVSATRYIKNVLFYEGPTSVNFNPTVYTDIGSVMDRKKKLLSVHKSQVFQTRIADLSIIESAISTAYFRGYQGRYKYAEGFMPVRLSIKL